MDDFLYKCLDEFETKFDPVYNKAETTEELDSQHAEIKNQVLNNIPKKWQETFGKKRELPKHVKELVSRKIDESFQNLKTYFEEEKASKGFRLVKYHEGQEMVLNEYKKNMETYFNNNPFPSRQDLEEQHLKLLEDAKNKAVLSGAHVNLLTKLTHGIEAQYKEYIKRIKALETARPEADIAIGIDLGTTNCCVMVVRVDGQPPEIITDQNQGNRRTTPSYVAYHSDGTDTYGRQAKEKAYRFPEITIYDAKRIIGRPWEDANLQKDKLSWPFDIVEENGNTKIKTGERTRYPHEVSARLLRQFRHMAEQHLGVPSGTIRKAVVTVPAYFTELQRRATYDAASCAGLEILNILSEPTAAAVAYSFERKLDGNRTALIYDLGGGTFDVAIAKVSDSDVTILGVDGDSHLGGQDIDVLLMQYCVEEFKNVTGHDLMKGRNSEQKPVKDESLRALTRVKAMCEEAKEQLSSETSTDVFVECLVGKQDMKVAITRTTLDELSKPLIKKTIDIVAKAIQDAKTKGINGKDDIDDVILVGGSTRMCIVEQMLSEYFPGKLLCKSINPDEAVAYGAAIRANAISKKVDGCAKTKPRPHVQDVLPISVGIEVLGEQFSPILEKNSPIPRTFPKPYTTTAHFQTRARIKIFQGESMWIKDNQLLGEFLVEGIPPDLAGAQTVTVTMTISSDGMLLVEACSETLPDKKGRIQITADRLGMDELSIERLTHTLENMPKPKPRMVQ